MSELVRGSDFIPGSGAVVRILRGEALDTPIPDDSIQLKPGEPMLRDPDYYVDVEGEKWLILEYGEADITCPDCGDTKPKQGYMLQPPAKYVGAVGFIVQCNNCRLYIVDMAVALAP